jgi:hypothetical protein
MNVGIIRPHLFQGQVYFADCFKDADLNHPVSFLGGISTVGQLRSACLRIQFQIRRHRRRSLYI